MLREPRVHWLRTYWLDCPKSENEKKENLTFDPFLVSICLPWYLSIYPYLFIYLSMGILESCIPSSNCSLIPENQPSSILQFLIQSINQSSSSYSEQIGARFLGVRVSGFLESSCGVLGGFLEYSRIRGFSDFSAEIN